MPSRSRRWVVGSVAFVTVVLALTLRTSRHGSEPSPGFCGPMPDICDNLDFADHVFLGEVLGVSLRLRTEGGTAAEDSVNVVSFRMLRVFKGDATNAGREWSGEFHEGRLAHRFVKGEQVVVYARRSYRNLLETACGRTRAFSPDDAALAQELTQLAACQ